MKQKIYKIFVNYEKEEKWLNEMAAKGLHLNNYTFGRYNFEEGNAGEYIYRIELLDHVPSHPESKSYIKWMEESGVECVATYFRWVYFRKKATEGEFDLYSDYDSRISHYKKVASLAAILGGFNLVVAIFNTILGLSQEHHISIYLTTANWLIVIVFIPMLISYIKKIKRLKKEKLLFE